jgi:hypothetical protein
MTIDHELLSDIQAEADQLVYDIVKVLQGENRRR